LSASLAQTTYEQMRADVIFGKLAPGARLRLEDLRGRYGVSVPTLREVLSRLGSEALVVAEEQRGFSVAPISEANLKELAALRALIELHALERSFMAGDVEWKSQVVAAHHKLGRIEQRMIAGEPCDRTEWKRYDSGFHHALIKGCGSAELLAVHRSVFDRYLRYQMVYLTFRGQVAIDEHQTLLEAALDRDVARGQAVLVRHIEDGVAHALRAHAAQNGSGTVLQPR
jgi:DNA-binding GntR family transcriptional regulator